MRSLPALDTKTNINHSPHVVILGAGASKASFPNGDAYGKQLPLMNELITFVELTEQLTCATEITQSNNFEDIYDVLATSGNYPELIKNLEKKIYEYFARMTLIPEVSIYDHLILSLREKDLIATFNWDPLLAQSYRRNLHIGELPQLVFLHGNVATGACVEHKRKGFIHQKCSICKKQLIPTKLLYPVKHKDYNSDPFIASEWETLRNHLNRAYFVTIYGYGAPFTDIEAKSLMLEVWKNNPTLELAEVDIVDTKKRVELENNWNEFLFENHFQIYSDIFDSYLFRHPRRSCEAFAMATLQNSPWKDNNYPKFNNLNELHRWLAPLLQEGRLGRLKGEPCPSIIT